MELDHAAPNVSNHGLLKAKGQNSTCLSTSSHSCCSTATRGGNNSYGNCSLSNIFDDDEERIDIFGENSMVGLTTVLLMEQNLNCAADHSESIERRKMQRKNSSINSIKSFGTESGTWQGSCNSFIGMDDELLDLSFTVNDFDKQNDGLSLHKSLNENTLGAGAGQTKRIPRNLSKKDIELSNYKNKSSPKSFKACIQGMQRTALSKATNSVFVTGGGMQRCFGDDNGNSGADHSPRKPVRRCEKEDEKMRPYNETTLSLTKLMRDAADLLSLPVDDSSCCEVIKISIPSPSKKEEQAESDHHERGLSLASDDDVTTSPLQFSTRSRGEISSKEDTAPKYPRRGKSPPPSPRKKVMMIALKDLEKYVSDVPETNGKSQNAAISPLKYKSIMKAAEDIGSLPSSTKHSIPKSVAVSCSDRSVSSMDDSGRSSIKDNARSPPAHVTMKRRKNTIVKSKSSRSVANSSPSRKGNVATVEKTKEKPLTHKSPKMTRRIKRAVSCQALCEPSSEDLNTGQAGTNDRGRSLVFREKIPSQRIFSRSNSCRIESETTVAHPFTKLPTKMVSINSTKVPEKIPSQRHFSRSQSFNTEPETATARKLITSTSKVVVGDCPRDRPPISPRRYATPTKRASFRSRSK